MSGGMVMAGAGALLVYLWVTGQLAPLISRVTDAAKGTHVPEAFRREYAVRPNERI